ncbi:MAG: MATE family efflux transporter [Gammaproteobacteria bacterium WSBS_2016_MAG_OTU1]
MAFPAAAGLFCNTLFNITDAFYAGWIATEAQAALTFAFPLYFVQLALCVGILQATTARTSEAVGGGFMVRARQISGQCLTLGLLTCGFIWVFLLPLSDNMLSLLGASGKAKVWAEEYIDVIFIGSPAFIGAFALNGVLHAVGNTTAFRNSIAVATLVNIILDPMLMFGWWGLPELGVSGIGWATVIAQTGCALYMLHALTKTSIARYWSWRFLIPRVHFFLQLAKHALTPTGRMLCINVGFFIIVGFLGYFKEEVVAGYGIALRLEQLFLLPTIGMEAAMIAYAGQNLGGGRLQRIVAAYFLCLRQGWVVMAVGALIMVFGGSWLVGLFNEDEAVKLHGQQYLWAAAACGPFYVMINMAGAVFLAAARHKILLIATVLRLIVVPLILCYILVVRLSVGVWGMWVSLFLCTALTAIFMHRRFLQLSKDNFV